MVQILFIAVAAGAASTLLFASVASGSALSVPLFNLAPLPILIVGIGWSHLAALIAGAIAALALGAVFGSLLAVNFAIGVALPAWWLAYLVLLARPAASGASPDGIEWYPVGRIVVWIAMISSVVVALVIFMVASDEDELRTVLQRLLSAMMRVSEQGAGTEGASRTLTQVVRENPERVLPAAAAVLTTLMQAFTLWLAARIVRTSGRLRRPWPAIPAMTFPPTAPLILVGALLASFLPDLLGVIGSVVTSSVLTAYALLGLAVMHALTRMIGGRGFILGGLYGGIAIFGWPLLVMALLGLAETWLNLRGRLPGGGPPANRT